MKIRFIKKIHLYCMSLMALSFLSCGAPQIEQTGTSGAPDISKSYLYGRFYQTELEEANVGIILQNTGTKEEYRIPFKCDTFYVIKAQQVYAMTLVPGSYRIKSFYGLRGNAFGPIIQEREPNGGLAGKTLQLNAGKAYYIGDYEGKSESVFYRQIRWQAGFVKDNFNEITQKFRELYKKFDQIETINALGG
jgi:hypothetical protein